MQTSLFTITRARGGGRSCLVIKYFDTSCYRVIFLKLQEAISYQYWTGTLPEFSNNIIMHTNPTLLIHTFKALGQGLYIKVEFNVFVMERGTEGGHTLTKQ